MRKIKFRGRDGDDWYYGSLYVNSAEQTAICAPKSWWMKPVKSETVGQYTGLKDSTGKEIYEGDILKLPDALGSDAFLGVEWNGFLGAFQVCCQDVRGALSFVLALSCTVIGNVYDTPDLLEVKEDA